MRDLELQEDSGYGYNSKIHLDDAATEMDQQGSEAASAEPDSHARLVPTSHELSAG